MQLDTAANTATAPQSQSDALLLLAKARNDAFAEASQGRLGRGISLLHDALRDEPMSHDLASDMAALLLSAREFESAILYARRALAIAPRHGASLYSLGFAQAGLGHTADAIATMQRLIAGPERDSLMQEAPDLLPLVRFELSRLQSLI
ncbi:hypothetical protein BH11PSE10_BH11PSE10_05490 [soil metagenome]